MKIQEAIDYFWNEIDSMSYCNMEADENNQFGDEHFQAYELGIEALRKQIPQRPKEIYKSTFEQYEPSYAICQCNAKLNMNTQYCHKCGQKLEW